MLSCGPGSRDLNRGGDAPEVRRVLARAVAFSDYVLIGQPISVAQVPDEPTQIWEFEPVETWKGTAVASLSVQTYGGEVGRWRYIPAIRFELGKQYLVFRVSCDGSEPFRLYDINLVAERVGDDLLRRWPRARTPVSEIFAFVDSAVTAARPDRVAKRSDLTIGARVDSIYSDGVEPGEEMASVLVRDVVRQTGGDPVSVLSRLDVGFGPRPMGRRPSMIQLDRGTEYLLFLSWDQTGWRVVDGPGGVWLWSENSVTEISERPYCGTTTGRVESWSEVRDAIVSAQ